VSAVLGRPRLHRRATGSTNADAQRVAAAGAPHGTLVTACAQAAGRGRQGRAWVAPPGQALLMSLVLRRFDRLLPLRAGLAVVDLAGPGATVKWPNDVLLDGRKVAGVLAEALPGREWAVLGVGLNVAVEVEALPEGLRERAGTLARGAEDIEPALAELLAALTLRLGQPAEAALAALRARDALCGRHVAWGSGHGIAEGINGDGALRVRLAGGGEVALAGGEVHLESG
jgi:BirA family biotin operon repressor/biotin-[acetyl-CoA-carboxylase] ligase